MAHKYTEDELNMLGPKVVNGMFLSLQDQMERMIENMEALIEHIFHIIYHRITYKSNFLSLAIYIGLFLTSI
jgi:hypothetical protein